MVLSFERERHRPIYFRIGIERSATGGTQRAGEFGSDTGAAPVAAEDRHAYFGADGRFDELHGFRKSQRRFVAVGGCLSGVLALKAFVWNERAAEFLRLRVDPVDGLSPVS